MSIKQGSCLHSKVFEGIKRHVKGVTVYHGSATSTEWVTKKNPMRMSYCKRPFHVEFILQGRKELY